MTIVSVAVGVVDVSADAVVLAVTSTGGGGGTTARLMTGTPSEFASAPEDAISTSDWVSCSSCNVANSAEVLVVLVNDVVGSPAVVLLPPLPELLVTVELPATVQF